MLRLESTSGAVSRVVDGHDPVLAVPVGSLVNQRDAAEGVSIPLHATHINIKLRLLR